MYMYICVYIYNLIVGTGSTGQALDISMTGACTSHPRNEPTLVEVDVGRKWGVQYGSGTVAPSLWLGPLDATKDSLRTMKIQSRQNYGKSLAISSSY